MRKILLMFYGTLITFISYGQVTLTTIAEPAYNGGNGVGGNSCITFVVENTNASPWLLTNLDVYFQTASNGANVDLWYSATSLSGSATVAAPAWTLVNAVPAVISVPANGFVNVFTGLNFTIPANTTYRFAVQSSNSIRYSGSGAIAPNSFTNSGLILKCGDAQVSGSAVGYGGAFPTPTNTPRYFTGAVTFVPAGPCINPPTPGTTVASSNLVCVGGNTNLSLSGTSFGTGQTFQWQSSPDNINWTNIGGATSSSTVANPLVNTWYRCAVTCGATAYSTSTQVLTQGGTLTGTYTINKNVAASATNFQSFSDLMTALSCGNISGTVTVNVVAGTGPYNERFVLGPINGAGPTARLIINGNGNAINHDGAVSAERATVLLDGADYVTIDSLRINSTGLTYGWPLQLTNSASNNIIKRCRLETSTTSTSSNFTGLVLNGSLTSATSTGNAGDYNLFKNNTIIGGYYGVVTASTTTARNVGNTFLGNTIQDFYFYGMYNNGQDSLMVWKNDISRPTRSTFSTGYGVYTTNVGNKSQISENWIHGMFTQGSNTTTAMYGIYNTSSDNLVGKECLVFNNLISDNINDGAHYYIYNLGSDGWKYYHNTIVSDDPTASGGLVRAFYQTTAATGIEFKNNLIYINRGGSDPQYAIYAGTNTSVMDINNNAYYVEGAGSTAGRNYGYLSGDLTTFAAWQLASGYDALSATGNPLFDPMTLYQPTAAYFNNIGKNAQDIVAIDFGGNPRPTNPDPGIWEFSPPPGPDMIIASMDAAGGIACGASTMVDVGLQNIGTDTVFSLTMNWKINGVLQTPVMVTDTFATGQTRYYTLGPVPLTGSLTTSVEVSLTNIAPGLEVDASNNTLTSGFRKGYDGNLFINPTVPANDSTFNSFSTMAEALMNVGVCGPVTVHVKQGSPVFQEQLKIGEIPGASASNRVRISGKGNTLQYLATNSGERGTVILNGTDYFGIDSLNILALGSTTTEYGFGLSLYNGADHNRFRYNNIEVADNLTSTNYVGISLSGSPSSATTGGNSGRYNHFIGNTVNGGYYCVTLVGSATDGIKGNLLDGNTITNYYAYGIYSVQQDSITILQSDISRPTRKTSTTFYGIYLSSASNSSLVSGNRIHNPFDSLPASTSTMYGMYITGFNAVAGKQNVISNNMIYAMNGAGSIYGMYISTSDNTRILHNTVALIQPTATPSTSAVTRGVYTSGTASNLEIKNNLVAVNRSGGASSHLIYKATAASQLDMNYNAFYKGPLASSFGYDGGDISKLSIWQSSTGSDLNSISTNPFFVDAPNHNYTPQGATLDGMAFNVGAVVSDDINKVVRGTFRDPGAIEFTGAPCSGIAGISITPVLPTSATVVWSTTGQVNLEWGPAGFQQGSGTGTIITSSTGAANITGLTPNTCYDVYLKQTCTSTIPGAPPVIGPFSICTPCLGGGLNAGTYTVGGPAGPSNFADIDSVIDVLNGCGIKGPVVFNVLPGNYLVTKAINEISGSSKVNTITFDGSATLGDTVSSAGTAVFDLNGARHFTFKGLTMVNNTGRGVWLHANADSNRIENCIIHLDETSTLSAFAGIIASSSATTISAGADVDGLEAIGNTIYGGYYGIVTYGNGTTSKVNNAIIEGNILSKQYYYGIYAYYNQNISIRGNKMSGFRNTTSYAVYSIYADNFFIEKNQISDANTYGLYMSQSNSGLGSAPATRSTIINNMIGVNGSAVYLTTVSYVDVYHNSLEGTYGFRMFSPTEMNVRNNIFVATSNYAFESGTAVTTPNVVNYNIYHKRSGALLIKDGTPTYADLAAWKTAVPALNTNSLEGAPLYKSPADLHVLGTLANDVGDNTVGVTTDFDGDGRPSSGSTIVDIGADEYTPLSFDVAVIGLNTDPGSNACGDSATMVEVTISNYGLNALSGIPITVEVSGATSGTFNVTFPGPLASLKDSTLTFGPLNTAAGGSYNITVYTNLSGDQDRSNDTLKTTVTFRSILAPVATASVGTFCTGDYDTLYAPTGTLDNYEWRDINGNVIGSTDTLVVGPLLSADTTFVLASISEQYSVGPVGISIGGSGNFVDPSVQQLYFTAHQQFTLDSMTVFPNGNGNVNINLVDFATNAVLQTITVPVTGVANPGMARRIAVGMVIAPGTYKLHGGGSTTGGLYRNTAGAVYPYSVPGVVDITGHSFSASGPAYYYYFYDWKISAGGCPKPDGMITLLHQGIASAAFTINLGAATSTDLQVSFDASSSVGATSYHWDFGNGDTANGMNVQYSYLVNGSYNVTLTITSNCGVKSITQVVVIQGIDINDNPLSKTLDIYPNPVLNSLNISFNSDDSRDVTLRLIDMAGKEVYKQEITNPNGRYSVEIELGMLPAGVYSLQIFDGVNYAQSRILKL